MKDRWRAVFFGLAVGALIRLALAFWRGSDRLDALMIALISFALFGARYFVSRSDK